MTQRKPYGFCNKTGTKVVKIIPSKHAEAMESGSQKNYNLFSISTFRKSN